MGMEHDSSLRFSRRRLGSMLAGVAGLSLLPLAARAASVDTLCVTCIDYRFVEKDVNWLNTELNLDFNNYDIVALAGASLAAIQTAVEQKPSAFWDQINLAIGLHHIKKVILLDHMDCGAYCKAYGSGTPCYLSESDERAWHERVMPTVAGMLRAAPYTLQASCFLMPVRGLPQAIGL
ncbi:MAG: hypothetical protein HY243_06420 [Proteobacteria bacterium]|nr:hypothetical protein [Pseudomonadota bacterium]